MSAYRNAAIIKAKAENQMASHEWRHVKGSV
jgi:hypothetical protein